MNASTLLTLLFDCGLAILLIATMRYCSKLSVRIKTLQDSRSEFASMITKFDVATNRALASVADLQTVSKKITDALQLKIDKANFLADDLAFLIEKSNKLILQLEQAKLQNKQKDIKPFEMQAVAKSVASRQSIDDVMELLSQPETLAPVAKNVPRTGAERELLAALKLSR